MIQQELQRNLNLWVKMTKQNKNKEALYGFIVFVLFIFAIYMLYSDYKVTGEIIPSIKPQCEKYHNCSPWNGQYYSDGCFERCAIPCKTRNIDNLNCVYLGSGWFGDFTDEIYYACEGYGKIPYRCTEYFSTPEEAIKYYKNKE